MTERQILPLGVHRIDADAYHLDPHERPSLSSSLARVLLNQSPRHAWEACPRLNPNWQSKESKTFDEGRAAHRLTLGCGGRFDEVPESLLSDDGGIRSKAAKAHVAEMRAAGITPLKAEQVARIHAMRDAIMLQLGAFKGDDRTEIDSEHSEMTVLAEIDGCPVRAMIDNAPPAKPYLVDLKTTTDASPDACLRSVIRFGYDVQAAHYLDCWRAATGEDRTMRFVFVEKDPPFGVGVVELYANEDHTDAASDADWMMTARDKTREGRRIWLECLEAEVWPTYPPQIAVLGAPTWHNSKWADRQTGRKVVTPETIALWRQAQSPEGYAA